MPRKDAYVRGTDLPQRGGTSFPTFASTGIPGGTTLTTHSGTTIASGSSLTARDFTNGLDLAGTSNVTLTNCRIMGRLDLGYEGEVAASNRSLVNCEINGNQAGTAAAIGGQLRGTMTNCKAWNAAQGMQGGGGTVGNGGLITGCFLGELYGTGDMHCEAIIIAEDNLEIANSTLFGNFKAGGNNVTTGGMSSAISLYNHGNFWGPKNNVYVHNCLIQAIDANTTVYWGTEGSTDTIYPLTNCDLNNNTFRKVSGRSNSNGLGTGDIVSDYGGGTGNTITGNVYEDSGLPCSGNR